jgi:LysM repeat protein
MKSAHFTTKEHVYKSGIDKHPVFLETKQLAQEINRLMEGKQLGTDHIHSLFTGIEQKLTAGNQNKTMLGKGAAAVGGAMGAVGAKIAGLGQWLKDTTVVQGVDDTWAEIRQAAASKLEKSPGGSTVLRNIDKYRQLVQKYPQTSKFFWNAAAVVGGLVSGGMAVPAILGAMKGIDALVQGKEFSTAVGQGVGQFGKTSAVMGAKALATNAAHAAQGMIDKLPGGTDPTGGAGQSGYHDPVYDPPSAGGDPSAGGGRGFVNPPNVVPSPDLVTVTAAKGDTLSQIAQANQTSVKALMQANPQITNPDALMPGTQIQIPEINSTTYMGGTGTGADTAAKVASGQYDTVAQALGKQSGVQAAGAKAAAAPSSAGPTVDLPSNNPSGITARPSMNVAPGDYPPAAGAASSSTQSYMNIGGQRFIPGEPLSSVQMAAVDMAKSMGNPVNPAVQQAYDLAKAAGGGAKLTGQAAVNAAPGVNFESIGYTVYKLPLKEMIDKYTTVRTWALNESLGRKNNRSLHLTEDGVNVVLYNIEKIHAHVLKEAFGDLPGGPAPTGNTMPHLAADPEGKFDTKHKGAVGNKFVDKVEGGLKRAGNWLSDKWKSATTKFEANRAKRRLQDAEIGNDSDAIAQWLISDQKVPQDVVTALYQELGFPAPAGLQAAAGSGAEAGTDAGGAGAEAGTATGGAGAFGAMAGNLAGSGAATGDATSTTSSTGGTTTQTATGTRHTSRPGGAPTLGTGEIPGRDVSRSDYKAQQQAERLAKRNAQGGGPTPKQEKAAVKDFQADADSLIRDLLNMSNVTQPAYVKYIRDRLSQHFPDAAAAPVAAPVASAADAADKLKPKGVPTPPAAEPEKIAAESRRRFGGKYVRESAVDKMHKDFEHFVNSIG